ncbi:hypothetical protein BGZ76_001797 [Entomortierella beljakovae]|nr:hypothetical protein BGZ76_001797 [Entomortierella beljakovae]
MPHSTTTSHGSESTPSSPLVNGSMTPTLSASVHKEDHPLSPILVLYHKATSTFLLRQLASAYSTSLEALELLARTNQEYGLDQTENINTRRSYYILKQKIWILHTTIFGAMLSDRAAAPAVNNVRKRLTGSSKDSPESLVKELWKRLVEDYGGVDGDVDGQAMVTFTLMCINQKLFTLGKQITEAYLATIPQGMLEHLISLSQGSSSQNDPLMTNYVRLVELYLIHVLAKLGDWEYATDFLKYNEVLSESSKKSYGKILNKLHQKSLRPKKPKQQPTESESRAPKSLSTSSSTSSVISPSVSSSVLSSPSTLTSPNESNNTNKPTQNGESVNASITKPASSTVVNNARTKIATSKQGSKSSNDASALTLKGKLAAVLKHYVELIKSGSKEFGTNQLMAVVGLVVFMSALSRNRAKVSEYLKAGMGKLMQTVKMGTTVTSI